jgi:hypothetical protein
MQHLKEEMFFMPLTKYGIEAMGFEEIPSGVEIEAMFNLVRVYHIQGIVLKEVGGNSFADLCHQSREVTFGFSNSINEVWQYLFNDDLFEDEQKWMEDNKTTPPFLIVHICLDEVFTCKSGYWKKEKVKDGESILTYDSFSEAKRLLKVRDSEIIPPLISSLSINFSSLRHPVRFKPLLREIYGKTKLGESIFDIRLEFSAELSSATNMNPIDIKTRIQNALKLYEKLNFKVGSFLHAALQEKDRLKKFLNLFFVIEVYTHEVFKEIKFQDHVLKVNNIPDRVKATGKEFFLERQLESKTLSHRFYWCALLVWDTIDDRDIENFKLIKGIRNKIAHGENIPESMLPIDVAEELSLKLLSSHS